MGNALRAQDMTQRTSVDRSRAWNDETDRAFQLSSHVNVLNIHLGMKGMIILLKCYTQAA